jgi:tape measure domain-containing protein
MAATDTKLNIGVTTSGVEGIRKLAENVRDLAREGGETGAAFKELANEIDRIADTTEAVQKVGALTEELTGLRNAQDQAGNTAAEYRTKLEALEAQVRQAGEAVKVAGSAFNAQKRESQEAQDALTRYRRSASETEVQTAAYRKEIARLSDVLLESRAKQREAAAEVERSKAAYTAAKGEVKAFKDENQGVEKALTQATAAVTKKEKALDAAANTLRKAGVETIDFDAANKTLATSLAQVSTRLSEVTQKTAQQAAIERAVAESNARNVAIAERAARERAIIAERNAAAARSAAEAEAANAEAIRRTAEEVKKASAEFEKNFAVAGVRSANAIQAEIREIEAALLRLRTSSGVTGAEFDRAFRAGQERIARLEGELSGVDAAARRSTTSFGFLRQGFQQFAAAYGAFEAGRAFITANTQLETLRRTMTLVTGSTEAAAQQIQFLRDTANQAGVPIGAIANSFVKFQTSARLAGIEAATVNEVFAATANAAGQLGISGDRVSLMLDALSQIASKGTVSMEELRQQLGDSLPGALGLAARGLGITEKQLVQLVESGQLLAEDFLPAFAKSLKDTFGDGNKQVEGFTASWARLRNSVNETFTFIGDSGVFTGLTVVLEQLGIVLRGQIAAFELAGVTIGKTLGLIASFDFSRPIESFREYARQVGESADAIQARVDKANGTLRESGDAAAQAQARAGAAAQDAGQKAAQGAAGLGVNAKAQEGLAQAAQGASAAQQGLGAAAQQAGAQAGAASSQWVALTTAYTAASKMAEEYSVQTGKLADAKRIEGETAVAVAELTGDEVAARRVAAEAAEATADAAIRAADARRGEVAVLEAQREALLREAESQGGLTKAKQEAIDKIGQTIAAKNAEAVKSREVAEASRQEAAEARVAARVYEDNAARLREYRLALEASRAALNAVRQAHIEGRATQAQVIESTRIAASNEALYRDALLDTERALTLRLSKAAANNDITRATLNLRLEEARTAEVVAQANGNEAAAIDAKIAQKRIEIEIVKASAAAKLAEANQTIATYTELIREGEATRTLTAEKRAEYEERILAARAKAIEANASKEIVKQYEAEIEALRNRSAQSSQSSNEYVRDRRNERREVDQLAGSVDRLAQAEQRRRGVDAEGFSTNTQGQRVNAELPTWLSIFNQLKGRGLDDAQAQRIANEFAPNGQVPYFDNPGQLKYGGPDSTLQFAVDRAAEQVIRNRRPASGSQQPGAGPFGGPAGFDPNASGNTGGSGTRTVNINLNGRTTRVQVASDADAVNLESLLRQLAEDGARGG